MASAPSDADTRIMPVVRVELEPSDLAGVLAQHGVDPAADSGQRIHRRIGAARIARYVQTGFILPVLVISASGASWPTMVTVALAGGVVVATMRWLGKVGLAQTIGETAAAAAIVVVLTLVQAEADLIGVSSVSMLMAVIAGAGALLLAAALCFRSASLRCEARIVLPAAVLAGLYVVLS